MKSIKELLVFISFSFQPFFMNLIVHFGYLFLVTALAIPVFFIGFKTAGNHNIYYLFLVLLTALNFKIRRSLVTRNQLRLDAHYIYWSYHKERNNPFPPPFQGKLPPRPAKTAAAIREDLKKEGARMVSTKLVMAIAAAELNRKKQDGGGETAKSYTGKWDLLKAIPAPYRFIQAGFFLIMLLFVTLIAYLLTLGFNPALRLLIFPLGFFVVYFLNAGIIDPMVGLLIQKKVSAVCAG